MKVLHINSYDIHGGAANAVYRINKALNFCGVDSKVLVKKKFSTNKTIYSIRRVKFNNVRTTCREIYEQIYLRPYKRKKNVIFSIAKAGMNIIDEDILKEADIIHLHWINDGMISLKQLKKLSALKKPIVWTLHDMWPFTGGCHYSGNCNKYKNLCGQCNILGSYKEKDLSTEIFNEKKKIFNDMNLEVVCCSNWLASCAKESKVFENKNITVIPNCIDENLYKPIDKQIAKKILNLDINKKYILFGADNSTSDVRKGYKYLIKGLEILSQSELSKDVELIVFGGEKGEEIMPFPTRFLGILNDDISLNIVYSAADIFVAPSLEDNLPNTIMESLFSGTPVVAFNIGGIPDMIKHKFNGYLAEEKNSTDLCRGIQYILSNKDDYEKIRSNCRSFVVENFNEEKIANEYEKIYKKLLVKDFKIK